MSLIISRIEVSSPPGVSIWRTTSSAPSLAARSMPRFAKSRARGPDRALERHQHHRRRRRHGAGAAQDREQERAHCSGLCSAAAPTPQLPADYLPRCCALCGAPVVARYWRYDRSGGTAGSAARHEAPGAGKPVADPAAPAPAVLRVEKVHGERTQPERDERSHAPASFTGSRRPAIAPNTAARSESSSAPNVIHAALVACED